MQRKGPLPGKIFAPCVPERRFAGLFGCMARESCHELAIFPSEATFGMHEAKKLPRIDARERTVAESCHGKTPPRERIAREYCHCQSDQERIRAQSCHRRTLGSAFRAYPAIAGRLGTHSVDILPSPDIRECTASAYSHCQSPGRAALSTRGSGFSPLAVLWGSARNTFYAREWTFRLLGA